MRALAIGNSFSQDATHYLHQLAAAEGQDLKVGNLYIGGCSLGRHLENMQAGAAEYLYEENGASTGRYVSVDEALGMEKWDIIVTQQASHYSGIPETYEPYLTLILEELRRKAPQAELMLHQTWAYETDSLHPAFARYGYSQQTMYQRLTQAYEQAARNHGLRLIPSGRAVQLLRQRAPFRYEEGGMSLCRDGFHMQSTYGRYLLAAVWYGTLTGRKVTGSAYVPVTPLAPGAVCRPELLRLAQETADAVCAAP